MSVFMVEVQVMSWTSPNLTISALYGGAQKPSGCGAAGGLLGGVITKKELGMSYNKPYPSLTFKDI